MKNPLRRKKSNLQATTSTPNKSSSPTALSASSLSSTRTPLHNSSSFDSVMSSTSTSTTATTITRKVRRPRVFRRRQQAEKKTRGRDNSNNSLVEQEDTITPRHSTCSTLSTVTANDCSYYCDDLQAEKSGAVVLVTASAKPQHNCPSLPQALGEFYGAVYDVAYSPQVARLMHSSLQLVGTAGSMAFHTALLPVTVPVKVASHTTDMVLGLSLAALRNVQNVLQHVLLPQRTLPQQEILEWTAEEEEEHGNWTPLSTPHEQGNVIDASKQDEHHDNPLDFLLGVWEFPGQVVNNLKDDIGNVVNSIVSPQSPEQEQPKTTCLDTVQTKSTMTIDETPSPAKEKYLTSAGESSCESDSENDYLSRLRLDYNLPNNSSISKLTARTTTAASLPKPAHSKYPASNGTTKLLLRVDDLHITMHTAQPQRQRDRFVYIDLQDKDPLTNVLFAQALDELATQGLSFLSNHPTVRLTKPLPCRCEITWKTEGSTGKLIKKLAKLSTLDRLHALERDTLIWSGKLPDIVEPSRQVPFFLARGIVPRSPRDFMHLLWDNTRTNEYNNFCLGRTDVLSLNGMQVLTKNAPSGTKIIQSETRVPFTGMSIVMNCLMHVRPLAPPDEGYVIVSRSLAPGVAGDTTLHNNNSNVNPPKNEILWGVNVLRHVPHHPNVTDLTSLSQVGSNMVPKFMAQKIGVMGIEDFFRNVRMEKK